MPRPARPSVESAVTSGKSTNPPPSRCTRAASSPSTSAPAAAPRRRNSPEVDEPFIGRGGLAAASPPSEKKRGRFFSTPPRGGSDRKVHATTVVGGASAFLSLPPCGGVEKGRPRSFSEGGPVGSVGNVATRRGYVTEVERKSVTPPPTPPTVRCRTRRRCRPCRSSRAVPSRDTAGGSARRSRTSARRGFPW